ncbi:protein kinase domain-containing protein [Arsenicicoccus sp. oral taxon 190]|uniref:protein kinase domain-containing protein n=1 Tax=Arsenicicoccus sp. oral taxon 190 TaxID=1658671 RepID=UPI00067A2F82|nr:serine/threonine-protein kinase [Arsenicicoccus sp. oral taxon 190]AKT50272.1 hypothetical protein ADJ73_01150 [Arsenicicoccus sp. oral taxon 190]
MSTSSTTPPAGLPQAYDTLGPYRLAGTLGEGGMGVVYLGLDRAGRAVAIKALRSHIAGDPEARARLAREVTTLERVQHPRVAAVLDADPDGPRPYIVTRYVPGPPLDDYVRVHGPFRGDALVRFARGLYEALQAIHAAGVVHRDLKPGNVLIVDDEPVVIDFGIAHVADDVRLTSTGLVMGTPGYLSPEVLEGGRVTESTDWWGWAASLAYAATGSPPFGSGRVDVILDRVRAGHHDLAGVDARLRPLLAAALAPDPVQRPAAGTVVEALEQAARGDTPRLGIGASGRTELIPVVGSSAATQLVSPATEHVPAATEHVSPAGGRAEPWAGQAPAPTRGAPAGPGSTRVMPAVGGGAAYAGFRPAPQVGGAGAGGGSAYGPVAPVQGAPVQGASVQGAPVQRASVQGAFVHETPVQGASVLPAVDPRLGKPARTGQLIGLTAVVAALATAWPVLALAVGVVWSVLARTVDRSVTATVIRRHEAGGARSTDVAVAAVRSPFQLVAAAASTVLCGLLGLVAAVAVSFATSLLLRLALGHSVPPTASIPLAVGALAGCWTCWWGAGGISLRRGSRMLMRGLTPGPLTRDVVTALLVALAAGLALWTLLRHGVPGWWPLQEAPLGGAVDWQF